VAINQIDNFLNIHLKQGFTGIKKVLYTNDRVVMFDAAHKQLGCTKLVGLPRLAFILNYMQKTVSEQEFKSDKDFIMYLQYYRVLFIELKNTRLRFIEVMREHNYDS
jgi:repressor of nif and glnA expression